MESYRFLQNIKLRNNASCIMKLGWGRGGGGGVGGSLHFFTSYIKMAKD